MQLDLLSKNRISDDDLDSVNGGVTQLGNGVVAKFDYNDVVTPISGGYAGGRFIVQYAFPNELGQVVYICNGLYISSDTGVMAATTAAFKESELMKVGDVKGGI